MSLIYFNYFFFGRNSVNLRSFQFIYKHYVQCNFTFQAGVVIFCVVTEPWISSNSCRIHKNMQNTRKFCRSHIKYMTVQHIWNLYWLLGLFTCCRLANQYIRKLHQQINNIRKLPDVLDNIAKKWGTHCDSSPNISYVLLKFPCKIDGFSKATFISSHCLCCWCYCIIFQKMAKLRSS